MPALARASDDDCYSRAANDACINGGPWTRTKYTYDAADRQATIKYPSGRGVTYTRDAAGRISKVETTDVQSHTSTVADAVQYLPFGPATSWTLGNGIAVSRSYDQDYRLTNYTDGGVLNRTLAYDTRNLITGVTDALVSANNQTLTYDNAGRVATAAGSYGSLAWTYNGTGDRLTETRNSVVDNYAYGSGTHHLASISGGHSATFSFDAVGNATAKNGLSMSYNNAGRLASAMQLGTIEQNTYDAAGHRSVKSGSGGVVLYRYDSSGKVMSEIGGSSAALGEYIYLNGLPLAYARTGDAIVPLAPTTSVYYFHSDQLGTPQKLTDANKTVVWAATYEPYGNVSLNTATIANPLRFPGQYFDAETGLYQNWNRDYDPSIGRYLQSDPLGLDAGLSTYGYAGQNPLIFSDPEGLDYWIEGAVEGEHGYGFHQSVCVGKWNGGRKCISFGRKPGQGDCLFDCKGHVYYDKSAAGPIVPDQYVYTDKQTDQKISKYFDTLVGTELRYDVLGGLNCRVGSANIFNKVKQTYGGTQGAPPSFKNK